MTRAMRRMRRGGSPNVGRGGDQAEGLKEFVELCMLRFGGSEGQGQREEEKERI